MSSMLEAKTAYLKARKAFRTAQDDSTTSDEDKKEQRAKMDDLADKTIEAMSASKHAADDLDLDFIPPSENGDEDDVLERSNIAQDEKDDDEDKKEKDAKDDDEDKKEKDARGRNRKAREDDEDKKEMKKEMDAMKQKMAKMEYKEAKMKLAMKYGNLFAEPMREARTKQFNSLNESIKVLSARVDEAATLLTTGGQSLKVASIEDGLFNLADLDGNSNNLNPGGKI